MYTDNTVSSSRLSAKFPVDPLAILNDAFPLFTDKKIPTLDEFTIVDAITRVPLNTLPLTNASTVNAVPSLRKVQSSNIPADK